MILYYDILAESTAGIALAFRRPGLPTFAVWFAM
jgi:hypothetical protein